MMHLVFSSQNTRICIFIGPRCPWGPIYGSSSLKLSPRPYADLTLADENTNSILTDSANRAFQGNVAMRWRHLVANFATDASGTIWWPNLQLMQMSPSSGQFWN